MKKQKRALSLGTILALFLTIVVSAGSFVMLTKMRADNEDVMMSAQKMANVIGNALSDSENTPVPQNHVKTVTVTISPKNESTYSAIESAATFTPLPTATPAPEFYSFTMTVAGIAGFHSDVSDSIAAESKSAMQYRPIFENISAEINSDINICMLPHIITGENQKYADVLAPVQILDALKSAGFDDLLLNSEHVLDQGVQGIENTVKAITERGFSCGGVNTDASKQCRILQLNGAKIAILTYVDGLTTKGKNALASQAAQNLMDLYDLERVSNDIKSAKAQGANCIMIFLHWGKEDATVVTKEQRSIAQALCELGADAIIGFHPSRVLPIEILNTTDERGRRHETLVAYSMGTLLTESRNGYDISGILMHMNITCSSDGEVKFNQIEYTPTYIWRQNIKDHMQYRVVSSNHQPPDAMDKNQQEVMGRALNRIRNTLKDCPIHER